MDMDGHAVPRPERSSRHLCGLQSLVAGNNLATRLRADINRLDTQFGHSRSSATTALLRPS